MLCHPRPVYFPGVSVGMTAFIEVMALFELKVTDIVSTMSAVSVLNILLDIHKAMLLIIQY